MGQKNATVAFTSSEKIKVKACHAPSSITVHFSLNNPQPKRSPPSNGAVSKPCFATINSAGHGSRKSSQKSNAPDMVDGVASPNATVNGNVTLLPVAQQEVAGFRQQQYVWDGKRVRLLRPSMLTNNPHTLAAWRAWWARTVNRISHAFLPHPNDVTADYWGYAKWRALHRVFSSMSGVFATQSMLMAVGVGAKRSLPASATINWVLKDGLGRLGRLSVATQWGRSFDADLKRYRFASSILYSICTALEYSTAAFPKQFLLLASVANVGKSVGLTTFIATEPAFQRSFCKAENMADISAKTQAQQMVVDNLGLALAIVVTKLAEKLAPAAQKRLPFIMFPLLAGGDLFAIQNELKSIHLRTLNKERTEILVDNYIQTGQILTPAQVSDHETLLFPPTLETSCLPLKITSLEDIIRNPEHLQQLLTLYKDERYLLDIQWHGRRQKGAPAGASAGPLEGPHGPQAGALLAKGPKAARVAATLRQDASIMDSVQALLQVGYLRHMLCPATHTTAQPTATLNQRNMADTLQAARVVNGKLRNGESGNGKLGEKGNTSGKSEIAKLGQCLHPSAALTISQRKARQQASAFVTQLAEAGWQTSTFKLSGTERMGYSVLS